MNAVHPLAAFLETLRPTYHRCRIKALDGRRIASASFTDPSNAWPWVQDTVAAEFDCEPDDVTCLETADGEFVAVRGERVAVVS